MGKSLPFVRPHEIHTHLAVTQYVPGAKEFRIASGQGGYIVSQWTATRFDLGDGMFVCKQRFLVVLILYSLTQQSWAQPANPSDDDRRLSGVLSLISLFSAQMCYEVPRDNETSTLKLAAHADAEILGFLKKAVNLGVGTADEYQKSKEKLAVLRSDLAAALHQRDICKQHYYDSLIDRLLPQHRLPPPLLPAKPSVAARNPPTVPRPQPEFPDIRQATFTLSLEGKWVKQGDPFVGCDIFQRSSWELRPDPSSDRNSPRGEIVFSITYQRAWTGKRMGNIERAYSQNSPEQNCLSIAAIPPLVVNAWVSFERPD